MVPISPRLKVQQNETQHTSARLEYNRTLKHLNRELSTPQIYNNVNDHFQWAHFTLTAAWADRSQYHSLLNSIFF